MNPVLHEGIVRERKGRSIHIYCSAVALSYPKILLQNKKLMEQGLGQPHFKSNSYIVLCPKIVNTQSSYLPIK